MTDESFEVLCKPILENLRNVEAIVSNDDYDAIFDLKNIAKTKDSFAELVRLRKSLEHYMGRKGSLSYVGFLGHFSAGKTRTINSLISEDRPTGNNPTDTAITLITHESNSADIIATHTQGALAIGRVLYDHDILRNTVIVDTPGSGDPSIVEELVRDFLPVCDRLVYTFSAANPLDRSDLPVLQKARSELPFIPIDIVITRADEFRHDPMKPLDAENFNEAAAAQFKSIFCMRLLKDVFNIAVSPEDILLIDNPTGFHINELRDLVVPSGEVGAPAVVGLHSHKVAYFAKSSKRLRDSFVGHIDTRLEALKLFLSSAKNNHEVYQNKETMSNSQLTEYWRTARTELDKEQLTQSNWVKGVDSQLSFASSLELTQQIKEPLDDIKLYIDEYAEKAAGAICRRLKKALEQIYEDHILEFRQRLNDAADDAAVKLSPIEVDPSDFVDKAIGEPELPFRLESSIKQLSRGASDYLHESFSDLDSVVRRLRDRVNDRKFVASSRLVVQKSIDEIGAMLDGFIDSVRLYKSAILAMHTRQLADEAGIVSTIDELEKIEIPADRRESWLNDIVSEVFPSWAALIDEQDSKIANLSADLKEIKQSITDSRSSHSWPKDRQSKSKLPDMDWVYGDLNVARAIENAVEKFQNNVGTYFSSINDKCDETMKEERETYRNDRRIIGRNSKKLIVGFLYVPIVLIFAASVIYFGWMTNTPQNWGVVFLGNIVSYLLIYLVSKAWNKTDVKLENRAKRHYKETKDVMEMLIDDGAAKFAWQFIELTKKSISKEISAKLNTATTDYFKSSVTDVFGDLFKEASALASKLRVVSASYDGAAKEISSGLTEYYTKTELNLTVLAKVSAAIRQEAIEPSFVALNDRNTEFVDARNALIGIEISSSGS